METLHRTLTVYHGFRGDHPRIHIEGRYLEDVGFFIGSKYSVLLEPNRVTLTAEPDYLLEDRSRQLIDLSKLRSKPGDIIVQFQDERGLWRIETLKTTPEGPYFRVAKFPNRITGLAKGDLISALEYSGFLFYSGVVHFGSNQTVQVLFKDARYIKEHLLGVVRDTGCTMIHLRANGYTINAPQHSSFRILYRYLEEGVQKGYWKFRKFTLGEML